MPVVVHRLPRHQFHAMSAEALKIRRLRQLPIQSRRRNLQHIRCTRKRILNVDDRPKLPAELRAILVRYAIRTVRRWQRSRPVDKHAQRAVLTRPTHFHFDYFQPARARHPLGNLPDLIQIKSHVFSNLRPKCRASPVPLIGPTKKWAFAHWCASTILTLRHNSIHHQLYAASLEKTNRTRCIEWRSSPNQSSLINRPSQDGNGSLWQHILRALSSAYSPGCSWAIGFCVSA